MDKNINRKEVMQMFPKKECIAMLLAGGQGSRLYVLTKDVAKPAVPFGGKYRIIDFPLSNCVNSGIDTVGVLTQYQPLELNAYIGNGQPWDFDRLSGGIYILPPYVKGIAGEWYKGTANAIYQNQQFIEQYNPENVLILSGDHIYKMDYKKMLAYHKENNADCTIAVIDVPLEEASRFGIMNLMPDGSIYEFEEKPKNPKSTKASMGIYIFKWETLKKYLDMDENDFTSSKDFGKDIIPKMIKDGLRVYGYRFIGYWKDVGSIESLWQANMDILDRNISLNLNDPDWKIYSRGPAEPPHFVGKNADVSNSIISEGCYINGAVNSSVIFRSVDIGKTAYVEGSIIMPGARIKKGAVVKYAIVAENSVIEENAVVGGTPAEYPNKEEWGITIIGKGVTVKRGQTVKPKQMLDCSM
jgi:glucose-1-phosphate adenylyltransferase